MKATAIRKGNIVRVNNALWRVMNMDHVTPSGDRNEDENGQEENQRSGIRSMRGLHVITYLSCRTCWEQWGQLFQTTFAYGHSTPPPSRTRMSGACLTGRSRPNTIDDGRCASGTKLLAVCASEVQGPRVFCAAENAARSDRRDRPLLRGT